MNIDLSSSFMAAEHPGLGALYVIWAIPSGWTLKLLLFVCLFPNYYCCVPDAAENIVLCVVIWFLSQDNSPPMKLLPQRVFRSSVQFSSVQLLSCVQLFVTPWTVLRQASLSITNSQSLLKLMSIKLMMPLNHLILCHSLLLLPSTFPSIRVFPNESILCIRWPKYRSFNISPCNGYSGLISFRMDCLDLLAVQGILKSLLQHHSSKASILWCLAFFIVQHSHIYDYWKNQILTRQAFVGKVMYLLCNMLSRLVITFIPMSKHLLISWLQSPSGVILEPPQIKSLTVSIVSPSICHNLWDQMPWSSFSECWLLSQFFHSPISLSTRGALVPLHFLP